MDPKRTRNWTEKAKRKKPDEQCGADQKAVVSSALMMMIMMIMMMISRSTDGKLEMDIGVQLVGIA